MAKKTLIGISLLAGLSSLVLLTSTELKSLRDLKISSTAVAQLSEPELASIAKEIAVKVHVGEYWGSGILLAKDNNTYTVVTNSHVAPDAKSYQIETPDGVTHTAKSIAIGDTETGNDLALLQFDSSNSYQVAQISDSSLKEGEAVTAAGFPYNEDSLSVTKGKISLLSDRILQGGYQIGLSNHTTTGMSGGVLLNSQGEVIGVLGKGKTAILDKAYLYRDGTAPNAKTLEKMRQVSLSISITKVAQVAPQLANLIPNATPEVAQVPEPEPTPKKEYTDLVKTVDDIAEQITIRIAVPDNPSFGSGVLVAKQGNRYYVATAAHNFPQNRSSYQIVTPDGESYELDLQTVEISDAYDVAVFSFESDKKYRVATLGNYTAGSAYASKSTYRKAAFVSGFPKLSGASPPQRTITGGYIALEGRKDFMTKNFASLLNNGRGILYTNVTYGGMSGGAVLDSQGRLIGIHTGAESDDNDRDIFLGFSLGVTIQDFISFLQANQSALKPEWLKLAANPVPILIESDRNSIESQLFTATKPDDNADIVSWMNYGNQLWRYEKYDEAIAAFERVIEKNPNHDPAYYALGRTYFYQEESYSAVRAFQKATELNSKPYYYWRWLGLSHNYSQQYDSALAAYNKALEIHQDFVLYYEKGDTLKELERYEEAIESFDLAESFNSNHSWIYNNRGIIYLKLKQYEQALADFDKAIEIGPSFAFAYNNRGETYSDLKEYEQALADFDKAIELDPSFVAPAYNSRGWIYGNLKEYERAIADFDRAIEIRPYNVRSYIYRGKFYSLLKQYEKAIADIDKAIRIHPQTITDHNRAVDDGEPIIGLVVTPGRDNNPFYYNREIDRPQFLASIYEDRGYVYRQLEQYRQALTDFSKAIEINPQSIYAYKNRGQTYGDLEQYEQAIADYSKAIEIDYRDDYYAYNNHDIDRPQFLASTYEDRGYVYRQLEQYRQALTDFSKAIEINPQSIYAYKDRAQTYIHLEQYEQAIADYSKAIEIDDRDDYYAYNNRGGAYYNLRQYEQAINDFNKAIEINPQYGHAYAYLGLTYKDLGNIEEAQTNLKKAEQLFIDQNNTVRAEYVASILKELDPSIASAQNPVVQVVPLNDARAYYNQGLAYYQQGQFELALVEYSKAIKIDPNLALAYYNRGLVYQTQGQVEPALSDYNKVIQIDPQYAGAYNNRGLIYQSLGQIELALSDYNKVIQLNPNDAIAYYNRGSIYVKRNQAELAMTELKRAIQLNPSFAEAYVNLGLLHMQLKNTEEARLNLRKAQQLFIAQNNTTGAEFAANRLKESISSN